VKLTIIQKPLPQNGELVIIKIKKIMPHGAYVELVEYSKDAYLPISEIASGWIKNIHEFVKEGQRDVGKVIAVDADKGSVDVSIKKAKSKEKADKLTEFGLEKRYEKLFEQAAAAAGIKTKEELAGLKLTASATFNTYTEIINSVVQDSHAADAFKNKKFEESLLEIVQKNIKPKKYFVSYLADIRSNDPAIGIRLIRELLTDIEKNGVGVLYLGAPKYRLSAEGSNYLDAEEKIKKAKDILEKHQSKILISMKNEKHD
jgi:translation initiation factor 2 subunit 1